MSLLQTYPKVNLIVYRYFYGTLVSDTETKRGVVDRHSTPITRDLFMKTQITILQNIYLNNSSFRLTPKPLFIYYWGHQQRIDVNSFYRLSTCKWTTLNNMKKVKDMTSPITVTEDYTTNSTKDTVYTRSVMTCLRQKWLPPPGVSFLWAKREYSVSQDC